MVFSHVPLQDVSAELRVAVLEQVAPDYIISGHIHHESYSTHRVNTAGGGGGGGGGVSVRVAQEITVPTCSYRMGESHMGVGAAVIGE